MKSGSFKAEQEDALATIDEQLGRLADLGYVDEAARVRRMIEREFPAD